MRKLFLIIIIVSYHSWLSGQVFDDNENGEKNNNFTTVFYGDPGKAALYSLIVPGGGQIYNKRYWKAPIVWGVEGYTIYNLTQKYSNLRKWDTCWRSLLNEPMNPSTQCGDTTTATTAYNNRQSARSARDLAWIMVSVAHLFNVIEAFVDRHLINFDTEADLSYHNLPTSDLHINRTTVQGVSIVNIRIPLSKANH